MSIKSRSLAFAKRNPVFMFDADICYGLGSPCKVDTVRRKADELCEEGKLEKRHISSSKGKPLTKYRFKKIRKGSK